MKFVRTYFGGGVEHDPRRKHWAEYKCQFCGETSDIDVTYKENTFDFNRERACPHCKKISELDQSEKLKREIDILTSKKSDIEIKIENLISELQELEESKNE